ncbi:MAG TPA: anthranilate synthase component I [Phycisphaerae bacterium]|nr:anthranilate synthase component I [Phycisphaerae bacterium]HNU46821.1 anthranilate synthase component I [Phycisphaerae bacterium]
MLHYAPDRQQFADLARTANTIGISCSLLSDYLTPVSAFEALAGDAPHAFLLESVVGGEKVARYSFLGANPITFLEAHGPRVVVRGPEGEQVFDGEEPLARLQAILAGYHTAPLPGLPRFVGGAVGYLAYDVARHYERLGTPPPDDRQLPDVQFGLYDKMVIFDHVRKLIHVVVHARLRPGPSDPRALNAAYDAACARIEEVVRQLGAAHPGPLLPMLTAPPEFGAPRTLSREGASNLTAAQFQERVDRAKEYIRAGDIFQVVLAQRLSMQCDVPPFNVYRALRVINPSPFMFYLKSPAVTLVGSSPEILCRIEGRTVSTRPLAGTRRRGRTEAEDRGYEAELLADPKERAEHVMLVDLGRNDLARVCIPGSVEVTELMTVERYSHVMHICSNVSGTLAPEKTPLDALRSVLPVGTVSGAPKIRAMQIIDELETVRRGPYAGAVGYIDFHGNMDTCITLRTLVVSPGPDGRQRVDAQVGAGIVADSEPALEYQETLNKAQSMLSAIEVAQGWKKE